MSSKIVVTGIGATTPLGGTAPESWDALKRGVSGTRTLPHDWVAKYELPVHFAAEAVVRPSEVLERPVAKRLDPASQFALVAAKEAFEDAGNPDVPSGETPRRRLRYRYWWRLDASERLGHAS